MSASADIEKLAVFDSRIVQHRPRFAVHKGALSITNAPFNAIAASSSQITFNVNVPSLNVFMDRELEFTSSVDVDLNLQHVTEAGGAIPLQVSAPNAISVGGDFSLNSFPLHRLMNTLTATINDTTTTMNTSDVLDEVLRMVDLKRNRLQRTCPTMLDKYMYGKDAVGAINNASAGYASSADYDNVGNGAFYNLQVVSGANYDFVNGQPVLQEDPANPGFYRTSGTLRVRFISTEKLVLSPFIFSEVHGDETGLFGINNVQVVMNLGSPLRAFKLAQTGIDEWHRSITNASIAGFADTRLDCRFLTPSLDIDLPPRSVVPYMEYPRYVSSGAGEVLSGSTGQVRTQTITLPQIPDMIMVYARPAQYASGEGSWYLPIEKVSVNFDNFSGLLSSHTKEQLYSMSVRNGLDMDINTWNGRAKSLNLDPTNELSSLGVDTLPLVGGFLCIRPGKDLPLQSGQAPSVVGNYTLQMDLTVRNNSAEAIAPQVYIIAVNSGFFETQSGSSRILKGVLTESDVIQAPRAMDTDALHRYVGGRGRFFSTLGNALSKLAKSPVGKAMGKMAIDAVKKHTGMGRPMGVAGSGGFAGAGKAQMKNLF